MTPAWGIIFPAIDVEVHGKPYDKESHDHLCDLHGCDDPRTEPLRDQLDRSQEVIEVHDRVHSIVHGYKVQPLKNGLFQSVVGEDNAIIIVFVTCCRFSYIRVPTI